MKLIVSAHGMLAKEVVNSAGMVFGAIDDLDIVTFVPGENAETLKARYKELIDGYKEDEEILFLVDLFGGSPYNAAFETVIGQDRMDVITGLICILKRIKQKALRSMVFLSGRPVSFSE